MATPIRSAVALDVSGLAEVVKAAKGRQLAQRAVKAGAKLIQQSAKSKAPRRSGALRQSLGIKAAKGTRGKTAAYAVVGPRKAVRKAVKGIKGEVVPAFYAHLVEGGTRPHSLGKGAKLARKGRAGSKDAGQEAGRRHPGAKAKPFLGPAFDSAKDRAAEVVKATLAAGLAAEMAKAAARAQRGKK